MTLGSSSLVLILLAIPAASGHGAGGFESPTLAPGESYSTRFEEAGVVEYDCEIHPFMTGAIRVSEGDSEATTHEIEIIEGQEWRFDPSQLDVAVGDTVTWRNTGSDSHRIGGSLPGADKDSPGLGPVVLVGLLLGLLWLRR